MNQEFITKEREKLEKIAKTEKMLQFGCVALTLVVGYMINWLYGLCLGIFCIYSWIFYLNGKDTTIVDEIDTPEVSNGLRMMFKSWLWLIIVLYIMWRCSPTKSC